MLPYKCETCNQRFSVKWRLVHHQKIHEPKKEVKNDDSDSTSASNPKKVVLINTEVLQDFNTHECPVCHISFAGKKQLERHERVHGSKRFYQCDRCYLAFFWKSNYNRHRKQFCTRRVFQCEKCHRTFNKKCHFLRHKNCHDKNQKSVEGPADGQFDAQGAVPSTSSQMGQTGDGPLTSKDQETETEEIVVVPLISPIKGKPRASKQNISFSDKDETESKSDERSEEELAADPDFEPTQRKPRTKYERRKKPMTQFGKNNKPRINYERKHKCDLCHLSFRFKCDLGRHLKTHDSVKPYPCDQCDLGFNWKSNLVRHQKRMHLAEKHFSCDSCGEGFPKKYHLARHRTNSHEKSDSDRKASLRSSGSYDCNCDCSSDSNPVVIQLHPSRNEDSATVKNEPASSNEAHASNNRKETFKSQEVNIVYLHACYDEIKPDSKEDCNPERSKFRSETVSTEEDYDCSIHNGSQRRRSNHEDSNHETARKRLKKDVKEFVCSVCSRVFTRKSCHLQHERSHYNQPLQCGWCHRTFARKSVFERHQRIHTGEKPFQCEICRCFFRQKSQLVQHKKIHSGLKPHECEVCKRRFNRKSILVRHKMIHTGEKPFECEVCHLCFNQKSILVQHLRIHTGLKPYKCKKCNYCFTQKCNYRRHKQRVHISGRTLSTKCSTCDSNFPRKRILIQHEKNQHRRKFVFHIYNTRFARKRCTRKDKSEEAGKHLDQTREIDSHRSPQVHFGQNDDSQNCDITENEKILPKVYDEKKVQDIADFPDHCIPVDIYIRKNLRNLKSPVNEHRSNPTKIQVTKDFKSRSGADLESKKKTNYDGILEDKNFCIHLDPSVAVQIENSAKTEDKSNDEYNKKIREENTVRNQQMEEINAISVKEISTLTKYVDETSRMKRNSSSQERQKSQNDVKESNTHLETLNKVGKEAVGSGDKNYSNTGVKEADTLLKGCSENVKSVEAYKYCKDSELEAPIRKESLIENPTEDQQSKNALKNNCKEKDNAIKIQVFTVDNLNCQEAKAVDKNSESNSNSSDQSIGNKNCGEGALPNESLDKLNDISQGRTHRGINVKAGDVSELANHLPSNFLSNQETPERNLAQNNECNKNSRERETRIRTQTGEWYLDVGNKSDKTSQSFKDIKDGTSSDEILYVEENSKKLEIPESSMNSSSLKQFEKNISITTSTNSKIESKVSDHTFERPIPNATVKDLTSNIRDSSTVENKRLLTVKHGAVENTKHDHNASWINKKAQKDVHNSESLCNINLTDNSSHVQVEDEIEYVNETRRTLKMNKIAKEIVYTQGSKLQRKANRSRRRLKYKTMFGRKLVNSSQESTQQEENVREALSSLKIHDESTTVETNEIKEEQISITRQIVIYQTKVIESFVKIGKKEENIPHSTVNFIKVSPTACPAKPATNRLEQTSDYKLKDIYLNDQKGALQLTDEDRKNLTTKTFADGKVSNYAENFEDIDSDENDIQKQNDDQSKNIFIDQMPGLTFRIDEKLDKERKFQNNTVNKQTHYGYNLQSRERNILNAGEEAADRKQVPELCKDELRNVIELQQEKSFEILKSNGLKLSENEESSSLNHGNVDERSNGELEEITTFRKSDEISISEFSEKTTNLSESLSIERQTGVSDLLEEIDRNPKPIQCGEINYTQNTGEEINSKENFVTYKGVSNIIDDGQLNIIDQNNLQKNFNGEKCFPENTDDQVSSSGISPDCGFPQNNQTAQSSSEQVEILSETYMGSERREPTQNLHMNEKNSSDAFGFIDFSSLSSPERFSDFRTKFEIPSFDAYKSTVQFQERDDAQNCLFYERNRKNHSLDLINDTGTDLEFTPLQNMRSERASTECSDGVLSYQEMSENFSTPNKNRNNQRLQTFESEKNNSNFMLLNETQGGLRPHEYHEYVIPLENIYQHTTSIIPVSETVQSIPSYTEAFSRPGLTVNDNSSVYTALYPESVANSHNSVSRKDVGYTAKSNISNRNSSYDHLQYEYYMQNCCRDGDNSTPQDAQNQTYSDIFRLQQMNSVDDYFRNEDILQHAENARNDPHMSYKYQGFTPQTYEDPSGRYDEDYTFPTRCEESYNYSVRQEKVHTYAVHHEEVRTVEDLVRFEKTCMYPTTATEMSSMETSSQHKESNTYQSAFSSEAAFSANYFRMNAPTNQDTASVNVQPSENVSVLSLQLSPEETEKNSKEQHKIILQTSQELSRMRARSSSMTNMKISQDSPLLDMRHSPALPKPIKQVPKTPLGINSQIPKTPLVFNSQTPKTPLIFNSQNPKTPSRFNSNTPQGLFRMNVTTPQNSWTNLRIPQGTPRLAAPTPNMTIRLVKPSPQYPTNHPQGFVPSKGLMLLTSPGCLQDQNWRRRMDLDFDRNRRTHFESTRTATDNDYPKGIFIERHFRCDRCEHSFARKEDLIRHRFTAHEKFRVVKPASYMFLQ
ncbi:unnamed protein product [Larinioides sclopetarius]|uniref:C2H2-type domain-containing protein n=1 Tax=Larinioides sclopetarius TaxID=280406 RepID=A0AAV2A3K8_9ARAC